MSNEIQPQFLIKRSFSPHIIPWTKGFEENLWARVSHNRQRDLCVYYYYYALFENTYETRCKSVRKNIMEV